MNWNHLIELSEMEDQAEALRRLSAIENKCSEPEEQAHVLMAICNCLTRLERFDEAGSAIRKACTLVGESDEFYPRLAFKDAYIDIYLQNWDEALSKITAVLEDSRQALHLPQSADLVVHLETAQAVALVELGRYTEALPLLDKVSNDSPFDATVWLYRGACYLYFRDFDKSRHNFLHALKLELNADQLYKVHFFLGANYYEEGNFSLAKQAFDRALKQGHTGKGPSANIYDFLILISRNLGLTGEVERYSKLKIETENHLR